MDTTRPGTFAMTDPSNPLPTEPTPLPAVVPAGPAENDERLGRYDANVQLILRRLADADRTKKPRWWWQNR